MLLREMFSAIGAPKEANADIDWLDDLKFFIDNDNDSLNQHFFPAVKKHQEHLGNPNVFKLYIRPIEKCKNSYVKKFEITNPEEIFPKESLIELAKRIAQEQEKYINKGDYK